MDYSEEAARRTVTKKDLDKVMKGKHKKIKLWKNFTIGFELEILADGVEEYGEDYVRERYEEALEEKRDDWREEFYGQTDVRRVEDLDEFTNFMNKDFSEYLLVPAIVEYSEIEMTPKYGYACPIVMNNWYNFQNLRMYKLYGQPLFISGIYKILKAYIQHGNAGIIGLIKKGTSKSFQTRLKKSFNEIIKGALGGKKFGTEMETFNYLHKEVKDTSIFNPVLDMLWDHLKSLTPEQELFGKSEAVGGSGEYFHGTNLSYRVGKNRNRGYLGENNKIYTVTDGQRRNVETYFHVEVQKIVDIEDLMEVFEFKDSDGEIIDDEDEIIDYLYVDFGDEVRDQSQEAEDEEMNEFIEDKETKLWEIIESDYGTNGESTAVENVENQFADADLDSHIQNVVPDGSVQGAEVVTKVFKGAAGLKESLKFLKDSFELINDSSELDLDDTTGLHINIGTFTSLNSTGSIPDPDRLDLFKMAVFLGEKYLLDMFNRNNNSYTKKVIKRIRDGGLIKEIFDSHGVTGKTEDNKKLRQELQKAMWRTATKFSTINFTKLNQGYIEFRFAGDEYSEDFDNTKSAIAQTIFAIAVALDPNLYRKEYLKKLAILFQSASTDVMDDDIDSLDIHPALRIAIKNLITAKEGKSKEDFFISLIRMVGKDDPLDEREDEAETMFAFIKENKVISKAAKVRAVRRLKTALKKTGKNSEFTEAQKVLIYGVGNNK